MYRNKESTKKFDLKWLIKGLLQQSYEIALFYSNLDW
jgi:hypothetical protein